MKSNTKGSLLKKEDKTTGKKDKENAVQNGHLNPKAKAETKPDTKVENKTEANGVIKSHPTKEINVSGIIGMETNNNDELLTGIDPLIVSAFQDKTEINLTKNETKIDISEILDDRWTIFNKYY
jgi:hypothetical protein